VTHDATDWRMCIQSSQIFHNTRT